MLAALCLVGTACLFVLWVMQNDDDDDGT